MNFRTKIKVEPLPFKIEYDTRVLLMGSCFSDNIGNFLAAKKFEVLVNPFGISYNPVTLCKQIMRAVKLNLVTSNEIVYNEQTDLYSHWDFHSEFSHPDKEEVLRRINRKIKELNEWLTTVDVIILTLGTSFVYEHKKNSMIVGNCHKFPANAFTKRVLTIQEEVNPLAILLDEIKKIRTSVQFLFTVSPVRHIKEGLTNNNLSKSLLRVSCQELMEQKENVHYFPSYEIIMDDLRDYRFYASDMIHPSMDAINYIWEYFKLAIIGEDSKKIMAKVEKVLLNKNHKYLNPEARLTAYHREKTEEEEIELLKEHPILNKRW